jgi:hypothetical protein
LFTASRPVVFHLPRKHVLKPRALGWRRDARFETS